jgi:hypothetical protein
MGEAWNSSRVISIFESRDTHRARARLMCKVSLSPEVSRYKCWSGWGKEESLFHYQLQAHPSLVQAIKKS